MYAGYSFELEVSQTLSFKDDFLKRRVLKSCKKFTIYVIGDAKSESKIKFG